MTKWVYGFGGGSAEGAAKMKDLLGGKGANLAEMANLGLPVPPGFTITTEVCTYYYANDRTYPATLKAEVEAALAAVGIKVGRAFGDPKNPLLGRCGMRGRWRSTNKIRALRHKHASARSQEDAGGEQSSDQLELAMIIAAVPHKMVAT